MRLVDKLHSLNKYPRGTQRHIDETRAIRQIWHMVRKQGISFGRIKQLVDDMQHIILVEIKAYDSKVRQ